MRDNKLAIVIPYFKLTYFEETLSSIDNQTDQRFNLYIGDDNSPEDPDELIKKYAHIIKKYKRYSSNVGGKELTMQWERCIDDLTASEEWIMLLCDDDILSNNVVDEFYKSLEINEIFDINVIKYSTRIVSENATEVLSIFKNKPIENSIEFLGKKILNIKRSTLSEHIFRRTAYEKSKFKNFELAFGSDDVAWIEFTDGNNIFCINNSYIDYRKSILSISNNQDTVLKARKMKGIIDSYTYIIKKYKNKMSQEQKIIFTKKIYNCFKALYYNDFFKQISFLFFMININGFYTSFRIVKNNKNYYE